MQVRVGKAGVRAVAAVTLAAVLGGCAGAGHGTGKDPASTHAAGAGTKAPATVRGSTIGAAGSPCALPVRFDIAKDWKAESIDAGASAAKASKGADDDLTGALTDALLRQGPVTAACEIDAKPAGNIGFLRVWTGEAAHDDLRGVLRGFVAAEGDVSEETYRDFTADGGLHGVEVEYLYTSKLLDETKKESAFAVDTPDGPVVVHLGGMDTDEHDAMLPAYELARRTVQAA
ncbi:lipoprotein [Streptomyces sp. NPDC048106]|uniref:lipoprotein n=1 Tax=Streptomyces sp. NPDC048106 TaxID=3155750 RepID=UPI0034535F3B